MPEISAPFATANKMPRESSLLPLFSSLHTPVDIMAKIYSPEGIDICTYIRGVKGAHVTQGLQLLVGER